MLDWLPRSVEPLGVEYQKQMREILAGRCIDVYENKGKRSGAYSAPVYGCPPFMLLNYNDTLDAVFTLAHEMGHSMHTVLAHAHQPFVYASYTITPWSNLQVGYGHFFTGDYISSSLSAPTHGSTDADYVYIQASINF